LLYRDLHQAYTISEVKINVNMCVPASIFYTHTKKSKAVTALSAFWYISIDSSIPAFIYLHYLEGDGHISEAEMQAETGELVDSM
jgi:hypothetical protein